MHRVANKIFLTFAVALAAFGLVAAFGIARLHGLGRDLRLLSAGYLPLTRIAAEIDVKDWVAARALEARALDPSARHAYLPVARAHFPALVREKIEEGKVVVREALAVAGAEDVRFLTGVSGRLDVLAARWSEYDREARGLLDAVERGDGLDPRTAAAFDARVQVVRTLERGLSLDVKLLQVELERRIADQVGAAERGEARTVALVVIYSLLAFAVGAGAALISRRLLAPIATLTEGVKAVAAGDLSREVEVRRDDEIGVLAREFNAMAASLGRQRDELRRAERLAAAGRIAAQITHEIRNPLNSIGLNAELLAEEIGSRPETREALPLVAAIIREVDRLHGVTEEYLRFSRLPRAMLAPADVNEILAGLLDFVGPELVAAGLEVRRELAVDLPAVRADEGLLRSVFLNLLRNSREATARGGTISVSTRPAGDGGVEVEVRDTGGGIPAGDLPRIFDPFYSTKERGTGLGLAFAQQVIQEHGGSIRCDSAVGVGTTFTVRLPGGPSGRVAAVEAASAT
ncbi:MAG TPA: ATP-binding protein [Anaeromyxobacteraceae bacterium]|nr:ATP-binding protein [Anaeromyxobacteraceae bacterium]